MKSRSERLLNFFIKNKWFFIGGFLITLFIFSNFLCGYKLSFTNVNYTFAPFNSTGTKTAGPLLSDIADSHYPSVYRIFYSGEGFSLWDSDIALGRSVDTVAFLMNPMEWVYFMPMGLAIFLKAFSEFALAFFFMFLFMRSINVGKYPAALSGILYAFSAVIVVWLGWPHSDVAAWAPLLFYAVEKLISTLKIKYIFLTALAVYMMLIVTMPTYAAYFLYLAGVYIVIFTIKRHWKHKRNIFAVFGMFALGVIIAALASLPYTYTILTNVVSNGYMDSRSSYAEAKLSWSYLRTFIFPYIRDELNIHINESTLYLGLAPIVVLPFALCNNKAKKRNIFFLAASAVVFALIFTDVFNFIYTRLPMINTSLKFRVITLLMFTLSVVTGITLNDILANREYYKKKPWLFAIAAVWAVGIVYMAADDLFEAYKKQILAALAFAVIVVLCAVLLVLCKKNRNIICFVLAAFIMLDSAAFARNYLPWISSDADVIPSPTDSVSYLMEHTKDEERIVGLGTWTLFPNTPSYYDLNDIRTHGFEATNADIKTYYTTIDPNAYTTNTRVEFNQIQNYELLKYLGVKYIYGTDPDNRVAIGSDMQHSKVFGAFPSYSAVSQDIELEQSISAVSILFATYDKIPQSSGNMHVSLISKETGTPLYETDVPLKDIPNNEYLNITIDENTTIDSGSYTLTLSFEDLGEDMITVWMKEDDGCVVTGEGQTVSGSMAMYAQYRSDEYEYIGKDSMWISRLDEYSDKVELAEKVYVYSSEDEILSSMAEDYIDNAAFLAGDDSTLAYDIPLTENESIELVEYSDSYVKILCTSEYDRYITLNDYYTENWSAYVNGEKVDIEKANYLMRAVKISSGEDIVIEFRYEPDAYYLIVGFSLAVIALTVVLFIFRKKLQRIAYKLTISPVSGESNDDNDKNKKFPA